MIATTVSLHAEVNKKSLYSEMQKLSSSSIIVKLGHFSPFKTGRAGLCIYYCSQESVQSMGAKGNEVTKFALLRGLDHRDFALEGVQ